MKCKSDVSIQVDTCPQRSSQVSINTEANKENETHLQASDLRPRSHSVSSGSGLEEVSPSKSCQQTATNKTIESLSGHKPLSAAHSLTDVSSKTCDNPACLVRNRNHRHSTPGRLSSYLRLCSFVDLPILGSTNSLFSTAVISGSSSAPDLKDVVHLNTDGTPSFPSIRPLETLHNALSLKHLDNFLDKMTQNNSIQGIKNSHGRQFLRLKNRESVLPEESKAEERLSVTSFKRSSQGNAVSPSSSYGYTGPPSFSSGPSSPVWTNSFVMNEAPHSSSASSTSPPSGDKN